MKDIQISIIVPVYNAQLYLKKCVNSICNQTHKNLDIILVNDGSTDNSGKICDELASKDNRIHVIHTENGGQSKARNLGLDMALGEYIGFVDSDDFIDKDMYKTMLYNAISENVDFVQIGRYTVNPNKKIINSTKVNRVIYSNFQDFLSAFFESGIITSCLWDGLYHKSLWKDIRMKEGYYHEDRMAILEVLQVTKKLLILEEIGYYYVLSKYSTTRGPFNIKHLNSCLYVQNFIYDFVNKHDANCINYAIMYKCIYSMIGYMYSKNSTDLTTSQQKKYNNKFMYIFRKNFAILKRNKYINNIRTHQKVGFYVFYVSPQIYLTIYKPLVYVVSKRIRDKISNLIKS